MGADPVRSPFGLVGSLYWFITPRAGGTEPSAPVLALELVSGLAWRDAGDGRHDLMELYRFADSRLDQTVDFLLEGHL